MKSFLTILIMVFTIVHSQAQKTNDWIEPDNSIFQLLIGEDYKDQSYTRKGIYLKNAFLNGKVVLASMDSLSNLKLRYNCLEDELIWLSNLYGQVKLDKESIEEFEIFDSDTVFRFKQIKLQDDSLSHFYQVYQEGKVKLYVQRKVKRRTDYFKNKIHFFEYKPNPQYFIEVKAETYSLKYAELKSVYILFPELRDKIHQRVKDLKLNAHTEKDFINFIIKIEDILIE